MAPSTCFSRFRRNVSWGTDSTHGRVLWLWQVCGFSTRCCSNSTPLVALYLCGGVAAFVAGVVDAVKRTELPGDDAARYGGRAFFLLDVSFFTWLCVLGDAFIACAFLIAHHDAHPADLRETDPAKSASPQPLLAKVKRFAYTFAWTSSVVEVVLYVVFAAGNDHRTVADDVALYSVDVLVMFFVTAFTAAHTQFEHVVWVLGVGYVYVFGLSVLHYAQSPWEDPRPFVYGVVDWSRPAETLGNVAAVSVLTVAVHGLLSVVSTYKNNAHGIGPYVPYRAGEDPFEDVGSGAGAGAGYETVKMIGLGGSGVAGATGGGGAGASGSAV